jgi:hypothetical protein
VETRTKRTYNLSPRAVRRVQELAETYGVARSQDAVVEVAIDRLYEDAREREEAELWARAADDPAFRNEIRDIERVITGLEPWPE